MKTVVGVFASRTKAEQAVGQLRSRGFTDEHLTLLSPGSTSEIEKAPTTETEQPGMGKVIGSVVGGAAGLAGGAQAGSAAVVAFSLPGVGPVIAAGFAAAALGAIAGAAGGEALENALSEGLPKDEIFLYEDALRQGRSVVIALAEGSSRLREAHQVLERNGAESLDAARRQWWIGLRDAEEAEYPASEKSFEEVEATYRQGFEAGLEPQNRNKSFAEVLGSLKERFPDIHQEEAFRRGYERGRSHYQKLRRQSNQR